MYSRPIIPFAYYITNHNIVHNNYSMTFSPNHPSNPREDCVCGNDNKAEPSPKSNLVTPCKKQQAPPSRKWVMTIITSFLFYYL